MPNPSASWNTVTVHGTYRKIDATAHTGTIRFTVSTRVVSNTDDIIFPSGSVLEVTLDSAGHFSIAVPAVDDPDNTPADWSIKVEEKLDAGGGLAYFIQPTMAMVSGGLNLRSVVIPDNATPIPATLRGEPGGIAELDEFGNVINTAGQKVLVATEAFNPATSVWPNRPNVLLVIWTGGDDAHPPSQATATDIWIG